MAVSGRSERAVPGNPRRGSTFRGAGVAVAVALLGGMLAAAPAWAPGAAAAGAPTFTVTSTADGTGSCDLSKNTCTTLRAAVAAADATAGATISLQAGTYLLTLGSGLVLSSPMTIVGVGKTPGAGASTIDGNNTVRMFDVSGSSVTLTGVVLAHGNAGTGNGGALSIETGATGFQLTNSTVASSTAGAGGGVYNAGTSTLTGVTVSANTAGGKGGGILDDGNLTIVNSTVTGNTGGGGGGIASSGTTTITYATVSNNTSTNKNGGGIFRNGGTFTLTASILAGNMTPSTSGHDCYGSPNFVGYNLVQNLQGCNPSGTPIIGNPQLGPLADNGGPTLSEAIGPGSPALDVIPLASCPAAINIDQRGSPRPVPANGNCDLGAFEYAPLSISLTLSADQASVPAGAGKVPVANLVPASVGAAGLTSPLSGVNPQSAPIYASPIYASSIISAPIYASPIYASPIWASPVYASPVWASPIYASPIWASPIYASPIWASPIYASSIAEIGVNYPGGWTALLATIPGDPFGATPLADITLGQLLPYFNDPTSALSKIALGDLDLSATGLYNLPAVAFLLGRMSIADIALPNSGSSQSTHLTAWCAAIGSSACSQLGVDPSTPATAANVNLLTLALFGVKLDTVGLDQVSLAGLNLANAPIGTPLGTYMWLGAMSLSLTKLGAIPLPSLNLSGVVDCTKIDCTSTSPFNTLTSAEAANAFVDVAATSTTQGNAASLATLYADNPGNAALAGETLGDLFPALVTPIDLPWQRLNLATTPLQSAASPPVPPFHYNAAFTLGGSKATASIAFQLPAGFQYVAGSATLDGAAVADPSTVTTNGATQLTFTVPGLAIGQHNIGIASRAGLQLGPATATANATASTATQTATSSPASATVTVVETFELGDTSSDVQELAPGIVNLAHISRPGDVDWYHFSVPAPASSTATTPSAKILLSNLSADFDLALFGPPGTPIRQAPTQSLLPVNDGVLGTNSLSASLPTETLPDIPLSVPFAGEVPYAVSANRGTHDEEIDTGPLRPGDYYVQVSGYNGASSVLPYSLQMKLPGGPILAPCPPRTFPNPLPSPSGPLDLSTFSAVNTLYLLDTQRLTAAFGAQAESSIISAIAAANVNGVVGGVVPVDGDPGVQAAFSAWDANRCLVDNANAVVSAIGKVIDAVTAANATANGGASTIRNIVLVGGDDQLPMARVPDGTVISNERTFGQSVAAITGASANNELVSALSNGYVLTDNAYGTPRSVAVAGHELFVPQVSLGRLVESATDITTALANFTNSNGTLDPTTAISTGYDFLAAGAQAVAGQLQADGLTTDASLINETWTKADLVSKLLASPAPDVASVNAHFDFSRALPAIGNLTHTTSDLFTVADVNASPTDLSRRLLFSMGCHAGLSVSDVSVGVSAPDWAQVLSGRGALLAANTGYGYGDSETVALSEELMTLFAQQLRNTPSVGAAMAQAKALYFAGRPVITPYDEKTLEEAVFYGLPMYHASLPPLAAGLAAAATATAASAGPSLATSTTPPSLTGVASTATFGVSPALHLNSTDRGEFYDVNGQTLAVVNRPIQPETSFDVTQPGLVAHGALITSLTSLDQGAFDPVYSRPTVDLSASTPELPVGDAVFPAAIQELTRGTGVNGDFQQLVLVPGQFRDPVPGTGIGVQRLFPSIGGEVYYTSSTSTASFVGPTIFQSSATVSGSSAAFQVVTDAGAARVFVLARDMGTLGAASWVGLDLTEGGSPAQPTWTGTMPAPAAGIQFIVQAVDANGNVSVSSNKALDFSTNAAPAAQPLSIGLSLNGGALVAGWYTAAPTATISASSGQPIVTAIDGGGFTPYSGPFTLPNVDGAHLLEARDAYGNSAVVAYKIDSHGPTVTASLVDQASNSVPTGWVKGPVSVSLAASDGAGSGVASVSWALNGGTPQTVPASSAAFAVSANGTTAVSFWGTDQVGNKGPTGTVTIEIDTAAPVISCAAPDTAWHDTEVSLACTATDSGSGLANPSDASFTLSTSVGAGNVNANASTNSHQVCDLLGNCATAGPISGIKIDEQPPTISISTPAPDGSTIITTGGSLKPVYSCSDGTGGSGIATCTATSIVSSTPGVQSFTVTATDVAGNTTTKTVTYTVAYGVCLGYNPTTAKNIGSTIPIKLQLCDAKGKNLSSASIVLSAYSVDGGPPPPPNFSGNSNYGNLFRFDPTTGSYIYNLSTGGQTWSTPGTHVMYFTVNGVLLPTVYFAPFTLQ